MDALFEVLNPHLPSSLLLFAAGYWAFAFSEERSLRARLAFLASMLGAWLFGGVSSLPFAFECWTRVAFGGVFMGSVLLLNGAQWFRKSKVYRQHPWALSALFGLGAGVAPPGLLCVSGQGSALTALFALLMLLTLMGSVLALLGVARWRWGRSLAFVLSGGLGLAAIAASATSIGQQFEAPKIARLGAQIDSPEAEMEEAPEAEAPAPQGERIEAPLPHELIREAGEVVALRGYSSELAAEVIGYNGHVPIAVTLSLEGEILDLELLPGHVETPGYYRAVERSSLVEQIIGKKVAEPIRVGEDIEGVTHATITSTAIAEGTKKTASRLATELAPLYLADDAAPIEVDQGETGSAFPIKYLSLLLLLALALVFERIKGQKLGWLLQITSVVVLGLWLRAFFSIQQGLDFLESVPSLLNGINPLPAFSNHPLWTLLVVTALLSSWVFGRVYCTYLCPFGALSALIGRLSPQKLAPRYSRRQRLWFIKYLVLLLVTTLYAASHEPHILLFEPFADFFSFAFIEAESGAVFRGLWLGVLMVGVMASSRFFCHYLCPAGAMMAFLARHRLWRAYRPGKCATCGECFSRCELKFDRAQAKPKKLDPS